MHALAFAAHGFKASRTHKSKDRFKCVLEPVFAVGVGAEGFEPPTLCL